MHVCPNIIADQSMAGLCKAEGANRVTTSNTKCIMVHLLLTGIDVIHYPMKLGVSATQAYLLQYNPQVGDASGATLTQRMARFGIICEVYL